MSRMLFKKAYARAKKPPQNDTKTSQEAGATNKPMSPTTA